MGRRQPVRRPHWHCLLLSSRIRFHSVRCGLGFSAGFDTSTATPLPAPWNPRPQPRPFPSYLPAPLRRLRTRPDRPRKVGACRLRDKPQPPHPWHSHPRATLSVRPKRQAPDRPLLLFFAPLLVLPPAEAR